MSTTALSDALSDGIEAVEREANGVIGIDVVRPQDFEELISCAKSGDEASIRLLCNASKTIDWIRAATAADPIRCGCCPRKLKETPYSVVIAAAQFGAPESGLVAGICVECATSVSEVLTCAAQLLRTIWADFRPITISRTEGHA
jgi:hypothetical protein